MSLNRPFARLFVVLALAICAPVFAAALDQSRPTSQIVTARIKLDDFSMIIVPVSINGSGPYDFMLNTGCSKSIVDHRLADKLGLSRMGGKTVVGMLASAQMSVVHADSLSVAGATVGEGDMLTTDHLSTGNNKVRGVLGEDFLRNFDVLIDYRHQVIRLSLPKVRWRRLRSANISHCNLPQPITKNSPITGWSSPAVSGNWGHNDVAAPGLRREPVYPLQRRPWSRGKAEPIRTGSFNQWVASSAATRRIRSLDLGTTSVPELTVIALSRRADVDSDGLIPTSLFHSVFISHFGRFVILNPSFPKSRRDAPVVLAAR